jgi:hypothetical protein
MYYHESQVTLDAARHWTTGTLTACLFVLGIIRTESGIYVTTNAQEAPGQKYHVLCHARAFRLSCCVGVAGGSLGGMAW